MPHVDVRAGTSDDLAVVVALEEEALGRDAWSPNLLADALAGTIPTTLVLVATQPPSVAPPPSVARPPSSVEPVETTVIGYAALSVAGDVAELQRIAVTAPHRRTGVASALLASAEREATARHADRLLLEVREDNTGALGFYARQGFTELDRRPRYYADGTTAIVLARDLGRMDP